MRDTQIHRRKTDAAQNPMTRSTAVGLSAIALLLIGGVSWAAWHSTRPAGPVLIELAAVDVSGSNTPAERKQQMGPLEACVETALPFRTPMRLWQFDRTAREMYNGRPESGQDLWSAEDELCHYKSRTHGTYVDRALREMLPVARRAKAKGNPVGITIVWDGDCADPAAAKKAAGELAELPNVRAVWLVGVKTEQGLRSDTVRTFAALGDRLIISGPLDARDGLDAFRSKVRS